MSNLQNQPSNYFLIKSAAGNESEIFVHKDDFKAVFNQGYMEKQFNNEPAAIETFINNIYSIENVEPGNKEILLKVPSIINTISEIMGEMQNVENSEHQRTRNKDLNDLIGFLSGMVQKEHIKNNNYADVQGFEQARERVIIESEPVESDKDTTIPTAENEFYIVVPGEYSDRDEMINIAIEQLEVLLRAVMSWQDEYGFSSSVFEGFHMVSKTMEAAKQIKK